MSDYEFIIIGSGAGGGTIANTLARAGRKILILERGDFLPAEPANWSPEAVFENGRYVSKDTWYDKTGKAFQPQSHYFVGGATKLYGAALFRLRPHDFGVLSHSSGISPAWPLTYNDMEPWYSAAEQMYQVHGQHGNDPTEGPWSAQYPHPPVAHAPRISQLSRELTSAGYHPFAAPAGVLLQQGGPCIRCNTCDGFPCQVAAKADAETIAVKPILDLPNVTLITNAEVVQLVNDKFTRRIYGVHARVNDKIVSYTADTVILSAGAANTAKILLASGLANSSDQVGRNFLMHNSRAVMAIDREPNATVFQKTLAVHDFYDTLGSIQMVGKSCAAAMKGESKLAELMPGWSLAKIAAHSIDFWLTTEDIPLPGNRVTLTYGGDVRLSYTETDQFEADGLYRALRTMLNNAMPGHRLFTGKSIGLAGVAHQAGTARMGEDPSASVLDVNCKAYDLENLYVVDASFMPSIGAVNPALTIIANALRVGAHLLEG
jgi:choline dehydrogenase-like flavoprotein